MTPLVHKLPANTRGHDYVVGSVLGDRRCLLCALSDIGFDTARDRLIATGNLVDCGPDSCGVIDLLDEPWFFSVRGVREERILSLIQHDRNPAAAVRQLGMGGSEWLAECTAAKLDHVSRALRRLPVAISVGRGPQQSVVLHGETPMGLDWVPGSEQNVELYLPARRHRIAAVHGRRRLMTAQRAARLGTRQPLSLTRIPGCALAVHARDEGQRGVVIGNQCYLPPLALTRRVWTLGPQLLEALSETEHGRQLALQTA